MYRHSTAHLLAAAVLELYPETKLGIGPPTDTGFFYDFQRDTPFTPDDLEKLEKKMAEIQARNLPYERVMTPKEEGLRKYADQKMKVELITEKADRRLFRIHARARTSSTSAAARTCPRPRRSRRSSCSRSPAPTGRATRRTNGCSASTAPRSSRRRSWTSTCSAWRKPKKRDHRKLGKELDLFSIQELAGPGPDLLPSQGRRGPQAARRLDAHRVPGARLLAGLHAARRAARACSKSPATPIFIRTTCSRRWSSTTPSISSSR